PEPLRPRGWVAPPREPGLCGSSSSAARASTRGTSSRSTPRRSPSAAAGKTIWCSRGTTSPRPGMPASSRAATACGCRISTRRTARMSTARASWARSGSTRATSSASARPTSGWRRTDVPVAAYAVASDTGRRRRHNEDDYVVSPPLFAVADGMGGAQAGGGAAGAGARGAAGGGEVASGLAAGTLKGGDSNGLDGPAQVDALIQEANRLIYDRASNDPTASGMGTTMTVALVEGMTVAIGHVGDSRAYLVRGDTMEQLTDDHSLVNELVKSGKLSEQEAQLHPQRSVITRAVGTDPD